MIAFGSFSDDDDFDVDAPLVPDSQLMPPSSVSRRKYSSKLSRARPQSNASTKVACPLCQQMFPLNEIERHAAECTTATSTTSTITKKQNDGNDEKQQCPVCFKWFPADAIEAHVDYELNRNKKFDDIQEDNYNQNHPVLDDDDHFEFDPPLDDIDTQWQPQVIDVDADEDQWYEQDDDIVVDHTATVRPSSPVIAPPPTGVPLPPVAKDGVPMWVKTGVYTPGESLIVPGETLSPLKNIVNLKDLKERNTLTPAMAKYFEQFPSEMPAGQQPIMLRTTQQKTTKSSTSSSGKRKRWPSRYKKS